MRQDTESDLYKYINTLDSIDDLNIVKIMVKNRRDMLSVETKLGLIIGEKVMIKGAGKFETGKILKINRTRAKMEVYVDGKKCIYTVPFSMIRKLGDTNGKI